jgi:hypothetical protein
MTNRVGPVFSEKMKNASTHHEIEYAEFIKSKIFVRSQPPRARADHRHAMDKKFTGTGTGTGTGTAVYRTAVPHECTMHGGNRHPDLDLE